jgi:predicted enzyme related to lactoylglutathione lyase
MGNDTHPTLGNGKICYIVLPALDVEKSAAFYKEVFGWRIRTRSNGEVAFDDGVGEVSGTWVTGLPPASGPGLMIHIMVDDIHVAIAAILDNGGKLVQQVGADAPEITAHFSDPAGNVLGIYQEPG